MGRGKELGSGGYVGSEMGSYGPNPGLGRALGLAPAEEAQIQGAPSAQLGLTPGQGDILPWPCGELQLPPKLTCWQVRTAPQFFCISRLSLCVISRLSL